MPHNMSHSLSCGLMPQCGGSSHSFPSMATMLNLLIMTEAVPGDLFPPHPDAIKPRDVGRVTAFVQSYPVYNCTMIYSHPVNTELWPTLLLSERLADCSLLLLLDFSLTPSHLVISACVTVSAVHSLFLTQVSLLCIGPL